METEPAIAESRVHRINGIKFRLGELATDELVTMRGYVVDRIDQAQQELGVLDTELASREVVSDGEAH